MGGKYGERFYKWIVFNIDLRKAFFMVDTDFLLRKRAIYKCDFLTLSWLSYTCNVENNLKVIFSTFNA